MGMGMYAAEGLVSATALAEGLLTNTGAGFTLDCVLDTA